MLNLPKELHSPTALYSFLGVGAKEQEFLEKHSAYRYKHAAVPKRNGGTRVLWIPERRLKYLQRKLLGLLEQLHAPRKTAHGFVRGRSSITNANAHQTRPFLLNIDLKDFFVTISRRRVLGLLESLGIPTEVAEAICCICVTRNQLPQGAPTSPILSNMVAYRLDRDLMRFAKAHRLRYTRYADDISLSGYVQPTALFRENIPPAGRIPIDDLSNGLRTAISSNGFTINANKVWYSTRDGRKEVTGLVVNEFTNVKRGFVRNIRAALYKIEKVGVSVAEQEYQSRYKTKSPLAQILKGRLDWLAQVRGKSFNAYRSLAKRYNKLFPHTSVSIDPTYEEIAEQAVWVIEYFIDDKSEQGTAFFLEGVGLVTADHVIAQLPKGQSADLHNLSEPGKKFKATPTDKRCATRDLAILDHDIPEKSYLFLSAASAPEQTNDDVIALGFPNYGIGEQLQKRRGHINGRATKHGVKFIEVSSILAGGISGGPVVNDRYEVIAIALRGGKDEHKQWAIDVAEVIKLAGEKSQLTAPPPSA
ncbi:MAG: trypsin-like peptidase domain-containing protein [Xanthobacteraceae bacterium]|nr:trypsin-like peptidase domain-containing protein [Xanthobacteraceae bacterium]